MLKRLFENKSLKTRRVPQTEIFTLSKHQLIRFVPSDTVCLVISNSTNFGGYPDAVSKPLHSASMYVCMYV